PERLVVLHPARALHRARRPRLHPGGSRARGGARPAAARAPARQMTQPLLSVRDLHVTYRPEGGPVPAVRGVSFDVASGQTLGLAGESGCGKSSVAGALLRLLPQRTEVAGEVLLDGEDVLGMSPNHLRAVRWTELSIVFQGALHTLNPVQRVGDQIAEAILVH